MPEYTYKDTSGHITSVTHRMLYSTAIVCTTCDAQMWRVPQSITVTWGGLAPSAGEPAPEVQDAIKNVDRNRAEFEEVHEEHERTSNNEVCS
jgi:hypothetical protein